MLNLVALLACRIPSPELGYEWSPARADLPDGDLYVLHVATSDFAERAAMRGGDRHVLHAPISAYLYRHPARGLLLIDAGYGRRTAAAPGDFPARVISRQTGLVMGVPAADQLLSAGIAPGDVQNIVLTHLHIDHSAGVEDFPDATLWVAEAEWNVA